MPTEVNQIQMLDISRPDEVQIQFSPNREVLWVNVDGICRLRIVGPSVRDAYDDLHLGDTEK